MPALRALGLAVAVVAWLVPGHVVAQNESNASSRATPVRELDRAKRETLWIVADGRDETAVRATMDLAAIVDNGAKLRILPVLGEGTAQSIADILFLKGIDVGIVQQDALLRIKKAGRLPKLNDRIRYIAKLFNEEMHLVAAETIRSIDELAGKKVNFGPISSGTYTTSRAVFDALEISVEPVELSQEVAMRQIKAGEIAATVSVTGAPARGLTGVAPVDGLRLLAIPYAPALYESYIPASLEKADYPGLIRDGEYVETIAVGTVMAVFNWQQGTARYERVSRFIDGFFSHFGAFHDASRHRKWREVNLAAGLPGWERFKPATAWLEANRGRTAGALERDFQSFLSANDADAGSAQLTPSQREALFREFVRWRQVGPDQAN